MENTEETRKSNIQYNEPREEQEISISQLLGIVKQRRVWIYVFFVFALAVAIFYLRVTNPTYEASATALVEPISNATSIEPAYHQHKLFEDRHRGPADHIHDEHPERPGYA